MTYTPEEGAQMFKREAMVECDCLEPGPEGAAE
jgi:hypothetical protein